MKYYKRILIIFIDIIFTTFAHPIMGRSVVLFSVPFIVSLLLLIKLNSSKTRQIGLYLCLFVAITWVLNYTVNGLLIYGVIAGSVAFVIGALGVFTALFINRFL